MKRIKNVSAYIIITFLLGLISACTISHNEEASIYNPTPANNETIKNVAPILKWTISFGDNVGNFKVLLFLSKDKSKVANHVEEAKIKEYSVEISSYKNNEKSFEYTAKNLEPNTTYYWTVIIMKEVSETILLTGPVWSFTISDVDYNIIFHGSETHLPNLVTALFQIYDINGNPVVGLSSDDFKVYDDEQEMAFGESYKTVKNSDVIKNVSFKTVIALDVSGSINYGDLDEMKKALKEMILNKSPYQEIAILTFAGDIQEIIGFTSSTETLLSAVDRIDKSALGSTDLYGAIIKGVSMWNDEFGVDSVSVGLMIVLTDGSDTAMKHTLEEALEARGKKKVIAIGVGNDFDEETLKKIGNESFISIESYEQVVETFHQIQEYLDKYISSFYLLAYFSPRRLGQHKVTITIKNTSFEFLYSSDGFTDPNSFIHISAELGEGTDLSRPIKLSSYVETSNGNFYFVNPKYEIYKSEPSGVALRVEYPSTSNYLDVDGTITFPYSGKYIIDILDSVYQIKRTFEWEINSL